MEEKGAAGLGVFPRGAQRGVFQWGGEGAGAAGGRAGLGDDETFEGGGEREGERIWGRGGSGRGGGGGWSGRAEAVGGVVEEGEGSEAEAEGGEAFQWRRRLREVQSELVRSGNEHAGLERG